MVFPCSLKKPKLFRLPHAGDLLAELNRLCEENGITAGVFFAIGAVKCARVGFYNQSTREYRTIPLDEPLEIVSCSGNISLKEDRPFVHAHICLSDSRGAVFGGHLMPGAMIFAAEAYIQPLEGEAPVREFDSVTGLPLWVDRTERQSQ